MDFNNFLAEDQLIEIIPKFSYNLRLCLLSGDFGPFVPALRTQVPIWLALHLRKQQKAEIIIPQWIRDLKTKMDAEEAELSNAGTGSDETEEAKGQQLDDIHENWREILKLLQADLAVNFKCLVDRREAILKTSVHDLLKHAFFSDTLTLTDVTLHKVTRSELHLIKEVLQRSFSVFQRLRSLI